MNVRFLSISIALLLSFVGAHAGETPPFADLPTGHGVVRVYFESVEDARLLAAFDVWESASHKDGYFLVAVDDLELDRIEAMGFRVLVDQELTARFNEALVPLPGQVSGIPGFPCYRTVEETYATAEQMVVEHPDLASWIDFGDSWEKTELGQGWDMMVLRLTNAAIPGPKPKVVVTSSIHAREYTPAELMTRFGEMLVEGYGTDADATWILDHHEVHLVLQANPDARKKAETGLSWRKNTDQDYCSPTSNDRGADLNRNFEFQWGCCGGSSGLECYPTYRGPSPASEPETQAIQAYLRAQFPDQRDEPLDAPAPPDATGVYMDVHSAGNLVLWPWGTPGTTGNDTAFRTFGRKLAWFNGYTPIQITGLTIADGGTVDFGYGDLGVASMAYELGTSFFQSCSYFENNILPLNLPSLLYAAKVARTPYMTPAGPDAFDVQVFPGAVPIGEPLDLAATIDDTRYNNSEGAEPIQTIAAAEFYVDVPPWDTENDPVAHPLLPVDGVFDDSSEVVEAVLDTEGLASGRHIVFVRGQDSDGNWGAFGSAFFELTWEAQGSVTGTVVAEGSGAPLWGMVHADQLGASVPTEPTSGSYSLGLPVGTWDLRASVMDYEDQVAQVEITEGGVAVRSFFMIPADDDGDGVVNLDDCAPQDPAAWSEPSAARDLRVSTAAVDNLTWTEPAWPGASQVRYDLLRTGGPDGLASADCVANNTPDPFATDGEEQGPGQGFYYLVRSRNSCGVNLGADSGGEARSGADCSGVGGP